MRRGLFLYSYVFLSDLSHIGNLEKQIQMHDLGII